MDPAITYLDGTTIVVFKNGLVTVLDVGLSGAESWFTWASATFVLDNSIKITTTEKGRVTWWKKYEYEGEYSIADYHIHRDDGPAIIDKGNKIWYQNGKIHRDDGPAVIWVGGKREWFRNDRRHRDDGPAVIYADSTQKWYRNGLSCPEKVEEPNS